MASRRRVGRTGRCAREFHHRTRRRTRPRDPGCSGKRSKVRRRTCDDEPAAPLQSFRNGVAASTLRLGPRDRPPNPRVRLSPSSSPSSSSRMMVKQQQSRRWFATPQTRKMKTRPRRKTTWPRDSPRRQRLPWRRLRKAKASCRDTERSGAAPHRHRTSRYTAPTLPPRNRTWGTRSSCKA